MTEKEYNEAEGIRRSDLWRMEDSPEKFKYFLEHPVEQTPAMAFGSACHKYVLEKDDFDSEYAVAIPVDRRTKEGKALWETFCESNAEKSIISADDYKVVCEMREALMNCQLAKKLLFGKGEVEVPLFWTDPDTEEKCKVKLDRLINGEDGRKYIVDYKTTLNASTEKFNKAMFNLGYALQAAMYSEGTQIALGLDYRPGFIFVAQEKKAPYSLNIIQVTPEVMKYGSDLFHALLNKLHACKELDEWPGYLPVGGGTNWTDLPAWVDLDEEEE